MAKNNLEEFAYKSIIRLILDNHFKPGDSLLETELSDSLRLSRTPVRHALGQLVAEGFLDKKRKRVFHSCGKPGRCPPCFFARENIEGLAAASAARYVADEDLVFLYGLIEKERALVQTPSRLGYIRVNEAFHLGIARISQNKYLEQYCRNAFWRSHTYIIFFDEYYTGKLVSGNQETGPQQHSQIVKAIENRNEEKACNLMKQHVRTTFEQLFVKL